MSGRLRFLVCLVLSTASGCGASHGASDGGPDSDAVQPDSAAAADAGTDASSTCTSDRECSAAGLVCDRATGQCVECLAHTDCPPVGGTEQVCVASHCVDRVACTTTRMCPGQVCSSLGYCVDCNVDLDCGVDAVCRAGSCRPRPRACVSSRECSDLGLVCDMTLGSCAECVVDGDCLGTDDWCDRSDDVLGGICRAQVCTPDAAECVDATTRRACDARGSGWTSTACTASTSCSDGVCTAWICAPGSATCSDASTRSVCDGDGLGSTPVACPAMSSCDAGACPAWSCAPTTATCAGPLTRRVCDADGLGSTTVACAASSGCDASTGACETWSCTPGSAVCADLVSRAVCDPNGLGSTIAPCAASESCIAGICRPWTCTPGTSSCASGTTVQICNADGLGVTTSPCAGSSSCSAGACTGWICVPGATTCGSATSVRTCSADGLTTTSSACGARTTCGAGVCRAWVCEPSAAQCADGVTVRTCSADGLSAADARCGPGEACSGGACVPGPLTWADVISAAAPVAWWPLDEPSGTTAVDVIGGRLATVSGGVTLGGATATGLVPGGHSASSAGTTGALESPFDARLNTAVFSAEIWARPAATSGLQAVLTSRDDPGCGMTRGWTLYLIDGVWQLYTGDDGVGACWRVIMGGAAMVGRADHLVVTHDGTTLRLYVNGVLTGSLAAGYRPQTSRPLRIGAGTTEGAAMFQFNGALDETILYDRALSPTEVFDHYRFGSAVNLARGRTATQSSEWSSGCPAGRPAGRAIDGRFTVSGGSCDQLAHTGPDAQAYWEVDLGAVHDVDVVVLWAYVWGGATNFDLLVRDDVASPWTAIPVAGAVDWPASTRVEVARPVRFVRVQRRLDASCAGDAGRLNACSISLSEVEVIGR